MPSAQKSQCPTPLKVRFATTKAAAERGAVEAAIHGHPQYPYPCDCGGAGMPCPVCRKPAPADGRHSIASAFVPRGNA